SRSSTTTEVSGTRQSKEQSYDTILLLLRRQPNDATIRTSILQNAPALPLPFPLRQTRPWGGIDDQAATGLNMQRMRQQETRFEVPGLLSQFLRLLLEPG